MGSSNLLNWLSGGVRRRELAETRTAWLDTEDAWSTSPLAGFEVVPAMVRITLEAAEQADAWPSNAVTIELAYAADRLLQAEDVGPVEADWPLIEADAEVAVSVRAMLVRRRRWALDFDRLFDVFHRQIVGGYTELLAALPDGCFDDADTDDVPFTVPLVSLLEYPAQTIERLLLCAYDDDVFRYDLFHELRERLATNLLVASGFSPIVNPNEVSDRLVSPTTHKSDNAVELADLYLGGTPFADILACPVPFRVPIEARFEHAHIVGGTGHGKTQLLQRMIHADLVASQSDGRSVVVIDSQGDLIQKLVRLDLFDPDDPHSLADRLILIDPSDVEYPPALNLFDVSKDRLALYRSADRERTLNGLVELYETFFGALLGAELTQKQGVIFRYLARLMLAIPGATIHTLMQLMEDGRPFKAYMDGLDGSARHFFQTEFFHPSFAATKRQILKRLWGVLSTPAFERMFAQRSRKVDLFEATNDGAIILVNTAKDLLKTDGSALFGRFFVSMIAQAALERSVIPERERTPTFVYLDEAQEYFDDSIETILSQARKYRVGITMAHQALDQLTPRLRSAFLANTSLKVAGGASAKDARALAPELHTTADFIEGMRKRGDRTEFAVWLKGRTPSALTLDVPLGYLERQATLSEERLDLLLAVNRRRYCGTLADVLAFEMPAAPEPSAGREARVTPPLAQPVAPTKSDDQPPVIAVAPQRVADRSPIPGTISESRARPEPIAPRPAAEDRELGKGGPRHRYLQSLVKELAEQQGFKTTIEAPLSGGAGQIDVLIEQGEVCAAIEISVSTKVDHERENVRKCLSAGFPQVALVLAKTRTMQAKYRAAILEGLSETDRARLSFLAPEDIPDFVASLRPPPPTSESVVKGYRVRVTRSTVDASDAKQRRDRLAKLVARSLREGGS